MNIKEKARKNHIPIIQDAGLNFLLTFIKEHPEIQNILEIGTAVGYSAIQMASLQFDIEIDTLEIDPIRYQEAIDNIENAKMNRQIHPYLIDASIFKTNRVYDLIFVDAAKAQYARYVEHFLPNTHKGSYFIFDNLMFHGMVENEELTHNRGTKQLIHKIQKFQHRIKKDSRFQTEFFLEIGDGMAVSKRIV